MNIQKEIIKNQSSEKKQEKTEISLTIIGLKTILDKQIK